MKILITALLWAASLCAAMPAAVAQSNPVYMPLGSAKSVLYKPDSGPAPHVAILVMHRTANYLSHSSCTEFSKRGFMVLCMNSRFDNNEIRVIWDQVALDVKAGVELLRKQPGIDKVILFGHSGGAPTMAFYQAVAEKGVAFCQDPHRLVPCGNDLAGLPPADGIVFADAHPGYPAVVLRGFNPALLDESNPPGGKDPSLDIFDPRNGYNPNGESHYSADFRKRFYEGQSARMNRIIDRALAARAQIKAGTYGYPDNDIVVVPQGGNPVGGPGGVASLHILEPSLPDLMRSTKEVDFVKNDGTIVRQIAASVAVPDPQSRVTNATFNTGTKLYSIDSFLSANAVRSTNSFDGIDHCSTNNSTVCAVQSISVPQLFVAMGAANFIRDNEQMSELSAARDKRFMVIEGAVHGITPCTACEKTPGQYANTVRNFYDVSAQWIRDETEGQTASSGMGGGGAFNPWTLIVVGLCGLAALVFQRVRRRSAR